MDQPGSLKKRHYSYNENVGLNIVINCNLSVVISLNVTLNVAKKSYEPYRKLNNKLSYRNGGSCEPPLLFRN